MSHHHGQQRSLTFDGRPGQYREFRRKVILAVAALEDKNQYLAGAKLLGRLTGEAWRCTEHLSVAEVRSQKGWLIVLECLDRNYKHLPEVELHESIDDFLFGHNSILSEVQNSIGPSRESDPTGA